MPPKSSHPSSNNLLDTWGRKNRKHRDKQCPHCGKVFKPHRETSKYCSRRCMWANNGGHNKKEVCWWKNSNGYIEGRIWIGARQVSVKQHRLIAEWMIGRQLSASEDVHHINGIKDDNDPSNLAILSHGEHSRLSNISRSYPNGYHLNLTPDERRRRSLLAIERRLSEIGRAAIAKATGGAA
jgi:hypothetical protein